MLAANLQEAGALLTALVTTCWKSLYLDCSGQNQTGISVLLQLPL